MRTPLMVVRSSVTDHGIASTESELVIVDTEMPGDVVLELDDGERISFNQMELAAAVQQPAERHGTYPESMHDGERGYIPPEAA